MKSLLLIAHGSRRAASNEEIRTLTDTLRHQAGDQFQSVSCAFLELAKPSISEGVDACVNAGASDILVLPYFLSAGRHVSSDIPEEIANKQQQYPAVKISIVPYLGAAPELVEVLLGLVKHRT